MRFRYFFLFVIFLLFPVFVFAAPAPVPETGQSTSYATGDDGDLSPGVAIPSPRFTDNGDGTVTDNLTGLIWLKNANCFGGKYWYDALDAANALKSGECCLTDGSEEGDWRLPNKRELWSLVNFKYYDPALSNTSGTGQWVEGAPFTGVQSSYYWSGTTYAGNTGYAWSVHFGHGYALTLNKSYSYYVWPVQGGQGGPFGDSYNLVISRAGDGSGTVESSPAGISCGGVCSASYDEGTVVTLTATPYAGSTFVGWSGDADCSDGQVTMNSDIYCSATFDQSTGDTCDLNQDGVFDRDDIISFIRGCWIGGATWVCDQNGDGQLSVIDIIVFAQGCN